MKLSCLLLLVLAVSLALANGKAVGSSSLQRVDRKKSSRYNGKHIATSSSDISTTSNVIASDSNGIDLRGPLSVLGGALVHLTLGTYYCWGNFISYAPPNLKFFDGKSHPGSQADALYVIPVTLVFQALSMPFGPSLVKSIGSRKTILLGAWITALSVYLASFQESLASFMLFYSAMFGTGVGLAYMAPMIAAWSYMPKSKGIVSGGVLAGFGAGGFFFSIIGSKLVNPKGLNAINYVFPPEVYGNFSKMLRILSYLYAGLSLVGTSLISEPKLAAGTIAKDGSKVAAAPLPGLSVVEAVTSKQFALIWAMVVASATAGLNTASVYKTFAASSSALSGDGFQAFVGGLGALFNGSGRLFWGSLSDKIGFKNAYMFLTVLQMVSMLTYLSASASKLLFTINTCSLFFCLAGNLALFPPATQKIFGPKAGATIYGLLYSAFAFASVVGGILTKSLAKSIGWQGLFIVMAAMSLSATLLVQLLTPVASYAGSTF